MRYFVLLGLLVGCGGPDESISSMRYSTTAAPSSGVSRPVNDPTVASPAVAAPVAPQFTQADCAPLCPGAGSISFTQGRVVTAQCGAIPAVVIHPFCGCSCGATAFQAGVNLDDPASTTGFLAFWQANCPGS